MNFRAKKAPNYLGLRKKRDVFLRVINNERRKN